MPTLLSEIKKQRLSTQLHISLIQQYIRSTVDFCMNKSIASYPWIKSLTTMLIITITFIQTLSSRPPSKAQNEKITLKALLIKYELHEVQSNQKPIINAINALYATKIQQSGSDGNFKQLVETRTELPEHILPQPYRRHR